MSFFSDILSDAYRPLAHQHPVGELSATQEHSDIESGPSEFSEEMDGTPVREPASFTPSSGLLLDPLGTAHSQSSTETFSPSAFHRSRRVERGIETVVQSGPSHASGDDLDPSSSHTPEASSAYKSPAEHDSSRSTGIRSAGRLPESLHTQSPASSGTEWLQTLTRRDSPTTTMQTAAAPTVSADQAPSPESKDQRVPVVATITRSPPDASESERGVSEQPSPSIVASRPIEGPRVHIGRVEVVIVQPVAPAISSGTPKPSSESAMLSRRYLRSL